MWRASSWNCTLLVVGDRLSDIFAGLAGSPEMMTRKGAAAKPSPQQIQNQPRRQAGGRSRRKRGKSVEAISRSLNPPTAAGSIYRAGSAGAAGLSGQFDTGLMTSYLGSFKRTTDALASTVFNVTPALLDRVGAIAKAYALWRPVHWEVIYLPSCSSQLSGSVEMGFLLDYADSVPSSTKAMASSCSFTTSNVWGGSAGSSLLNSAQKAPSQAVTSLLDCSEFKNTWFKLTWTDPTESEAAHLVNTYIPARFVVRPDFPVTTEDYPGHLWLRCRVLFKGSVSPSTNV